jgi:HK97 family phage major capsid protein
MQTGTGAYAGGNGPLVPVGFYPQVMAMMKAADDLFNPDVVGWLETDTGNPFSLPNMDDTSSSASIVAQGVQITTQDLATLGQLSFPEAPTWRSGMIKVSIELDTDAGFSLEDLFAQSFAVRFARGIGAYNVGKLLAAATLGATAVGASGNNGTSATGGTTVGSDDLYSLMGSVDPAYVASPKCAWVMNFQTMTAIAQLKDKNGRPLHLIKQNPATNEVELLMKPIRVCPSMANIGPNATPIAFGDLGRFIVRAVPSSMRVQRLGERFAEYLQVAYQAFLRADSNLQLTPGSQSPVKYLQNAAS